MTSPYIVPIPERCDLSSFEQILRAHYRLSKKSNAVFFDLTHVEWIGLLQASLLYGWAAELIGFSKQIRVAFVPGNSERSGLRFLSHLGFFDQAKELGVELPHSIPPSSSTPFTVFKVFKTKAELASYERSLSLDDTRRRLWPGGDKYSLVRDGELKDILLTELGENALLHGEGLNVRFGATGHLGTDPRKIHPILASFGGRESIEVVVSDSGPGLLSKLTNMPLEYHPDARRAKGELSPTERNIAYAFEFNSTGDEEGRKARIAAILSAAAINERVIATGLWYVMRLAKKHCAQLLVRTGTYLVSIDCTKPEKPLILSKGGLIKIPGTHIVFRAPKDFEIVRQKKATQLTLTPAQGVANCISIVLQEIQECSSSPADFVFQAEKAVLEALSSPANGGANLVSILCDGLQVDHKAFSVLLMNLSVVERRGRGLLLLGVRDELIESASEEWRQLKPLTTLSAAKKHGYQSVGLIGGDLQRVTNFGDTAHATGTAIVKARGEMSCVEVLESELPSLYERALRQAMAVRLSTVPVKHPEPGYTRFYLIEKEYYTRAFYEIGRFDALASNCSLAQSWIGLQVQMHNIGAVFVISEPLYGLAAAMSECSPSTIWTVAKVGAEFSSFSSTILSKTKGTRLLILADVICTAKQVSRYLAKISNPEEVLIGCLVDGRNEDYSYLTLRTLKKACTVDVISVFRTKIESIDDLPRGVDYRQVRIIDPKTHSPTSYDDAVPPYLQPYDLIQRGIEASAIFHGHLKFKEKHYADFIYFARLFHHLRTALHLWWDNALQKFMSEQKLKISDVKAFYLDEKRGWETLVADYLSTKGLAQYGAISRDALSAPPETSEHHKAIWFILPAIANGETARLCLEYGSCFSPNYIHVSVMVARMDSTRLAFYQNITGYRHIRVTIQTLSYVPLIAAPSKSTCSLCEIDTLVGRVASVVKDSEMLRRITEERGKLFAVTEVTLEELDAGSIPPANEADLKLIYVRTLFEESLRNYERRKELGVFLDRPGAFAIFIDMAGEQFVSQGFERNTVERITHQRYARIYDYAMTLLQQSPPTAVTLRALLGIHCLFPDSLATHLKGLFLRALNEDIRSLAEDIVFLALVDPERYSVAVAGNPGIQPRSDWGIQLLQEIRHHAWLDNDSGKSVRTFVELLDLLRLSSDWGTPIEILRTSLHAPHTSGDQISADFRAFDVRGVRKVLAYVSELKDVGPKSATGLWSAMVAESEEINFAVEQIAQVSEQGRTILAQEVAPPESLMKLLQQLDAAGQLLASCLRRVFTQPIDAKFRIEELIAKRWPHIGPNIRFTFATDQPGILIGRRDLEMMLVHVIDNADECLANASAEEKENTEYWWEVRFNGYTPDGFASELVIRDNLPWKQRLIPAGGMREFGRICRQYAAVHDFEARDITDKYLKIRVIFRIDNERVRHEHP